MSLDSRPKKPIKQARGKPPPLYPKPVRWKLGDRDGDNVPTVSYQPLADSPKEAMKTSKTKNASINPFRKMIRQLARLLTDDDIVEIKFLTKCEIVDEYKYRQKPLYYLIDVFEKEGKVTENNIDFLIEILREIESDEALVLVETYKQCLPKEEKKVSSSEDKDEDTKHLLDAEKPKIPLQLQVSGVNETDDSLFGSCDESSEAQVEETDPHSHTNTKMFVDINNILRRFNISNEFVKQIGLLYCMTIHKIHLTERRISPQNIVIAFLTDLMSYDYRAIRLFKELAQGAGFIESNKESVKRSCRDMTFLILNCCDPFLRQAVLSKMTDCQLAIPVLLPTFDQSEVVFLLWSLQNITKVWAGPNSRKVREEPVVKFPFPVVSVVRVGDSALSKSNILNKMLGQIQNNDDHPYFISSEQDSCKSLLSKGSVEGLWFTPSSGKMGKHSLSSAICFLNLRGDAEEFNIQREYLAKMSTLTIVFISKSSLRSKMCIIKEVSSTSRVILVVCDEGDMSIDSTEWTTGGQVTFANAVALNTTDIGEYLCIEINKILSHSLSKHGSTPSLEESLPICLESGIKVDILETECDQAKKSVFQILRSCDEDPKKYKSQALPLQSNWQKWSKLDKDRSWTGIFENTERQLANLQKQKTKLREQQREIGMSPQIQNLYHKLSNPDEKYKQFLIFWLQHFLNERSAATLKPLVDDIKQLRDQIRKTAQEITHLKRRLDGSMNIPSRQREQTEKKVSDLLTTEATLNTKLRETTNEFDLSSLGFEHFLREFGQLYECFYSSHQTRYEPLMARSFDVKSLPKMVAYILLNGHPFEIFDGDACHVPIKWVKGVLSEVRNIVGDRRIYVVSVIGVQSSGKSTLLNSMFGVRFAVSAGRCTRGIFLQLLPIDDEIKENLGCDFIAVIDTEGLKAPEKAIANRKSEDNELATFALCLSDMTLINIGGQTVGEDLSNILQISAHAFIRMKEVNLRSSCYLVQQFVADVTASHRNESSTQSILQTLNQAVLTAAIEEGKQDQYRQFSDCFNFVNLEGKAEDVQYVPSLWRMGMSAPNYEYSETVLKLKSALLREVRSKSSKQNILEFTNRIESVWNAVKEEDFVFNFHNSTEIAQYNNFTFLYKRAQLKFINDMMKWELDAKQTIRNASGESVLNRRDSLLQELDKKLTTEIGKLQETVADELRKSEHECVKHHATYFTKDIEMVEKQLRGTIRQMLTTEASNTMAAKTKESKLLPKLKANLRQQVRPVAVKLKHTFSDDPNFQGSDPEKDIEIEKAFEVEWSKQMKDVQSHYPSEPEKDIRREIESSMKSCIIESLESTSLSKAMKTLLSNNNLGQLCFSSPRVSSIADIPSVTNALKTCSEAVTRRLKILLKTVQSSFNKQGFLFSSMFVESITDKIRFLVAERCNGCKGKTEMLVCLTCKILSEAHKVTLDNVLSDFLIKEELLQKLNITNVSSRNSIENDVLLIFKNTPAQGTFLKLLNRLAQTFLTSRRLDDGAYDNFHNDLQTQFQILRSQCNRKRWYSEDFTIKFVKMVLKLIENRSEAVKANLLSRSCNFLIEEAVNCEKQFLNEILHWDKVKQELKLEAISLSEQKKMFLQILQEILPTDVLHVLGSMQDADIQKHAMIPLSHSHVLDQRLLSLIPVLRPDKYDTILSIIADAQVLFLRLLMEYTHYNTHFMKSIIATIMEELHKHDDLESEEQVLTVAFICSWALPICQAMEITFVKEHSMQSLLEQEKEHLYSEFRDLCQGACQDHSAAKSLTAIIKISLTECIKNGICTVLFERLSKYGDEIFCSRSRFLQVVLKSLCLRSNFSDYKSFIRQHGSFIAKWTLHYIASVCSKGTEGGICIREIAVTETDRLLRLTANSLRKDLVSLKQSDDENMSIQIWLTEFTKTFENSLKATLHEEAMTELRNYIWVSDFDLFTDECIKIIYSMQTSLLESVCLPDTNETEKVEDWFETLPGQIHVQLAASVQGCGTQCPFCKTFCDDTVKEHKVHISNLHFPQGIGGYVFKGSGMLVCDTCTALVASERSYYKCHCGYDVECGHPTTKCKEYRKDYPNWDIRPITDYEPTLHWKWVLMEFNEDFASLYRAKPASIPWEIVTKERALESICEK